MYRIDCLASFGLDDFLAFYPSLSIVHDPLEAFSENLLLTKRKKASFRNIPNYLCSWWVRGLRALGLSENWGWERKGNGSSCWRFGIESSFDTSHLSEVIDNLHKSCFVFVLLSIYYESVCISRSLLPNTILVHMFHVNEAQKGYCFSIRIFFPGKYLN